MLRMIIDTDTASDDAVALVMALRHPLVQVDAITVVAGNVPLDQAVQNALYTVELCGASAPVYAGRHAPLLRTLDTAQNVHGQDGMGDIGLLLSGRQPAPGHAVDVLIQSINAAPGEIMLVAIGPLTNVALAVLRDPGIARNVKHCVIMGGASDAVGNMTPVSEYNAWADPEAARIVFESGMPITMVGWDISRKYAVFGPEEAALLRALNTPHAHFCIDIQSVLQGYALEETKLAGFDLPDPIAMAIAIDPSIAMRTLAVPVSIELSDGLCRGQTLLDHANLLKRTQRINVVIEADRERFLQMLHRACLPWI